MRWVGFQPKWTCSRTNLLKDLPALPPPQSLPPLRPLDSPAASIPRYSPLHPPSRFDDPAVPGRWDPTLPPRDPATVGYPDPVTHEVPERDVGFPPTRRESPGDGAEEVRRGPDSG